ncbi:TetR family transcriptional regulator [Rhodococcus phenolicus]|uniref:TetR family transcriptional regulator n=1 Tax=Rhodococcus phenolicus TaxID=263849 RepID=UPI000A456A2A
MGESTPDGRDRRSEPTRSEAESVTVRESILDSAVENFQRLGYHGTSVRDIARDAGSPPPRSITTFPPSRSFSRKSWRRYSAMPSR